MQNTRTWIEISKKRLTDNVKTLKSFLKKDTIICPIVKANAYGHGIKEVAPIIIKAGANWLGVDNLQEAMILKEIGIKSPIYIMGYIPKNELEIAVSNNFRFVVYEIETLKKLKSIKKESTILTHLKLETGTNRQGVNQKELIKIIEFYKKEKQIILEGVATHFANIEDTMDHSFASNQTKTFFKMIKKIEENGLKPKYKHCANSASILLFPETHGNFVRPGISTYGLWPSRETQIAFKNRVKTEKVKDIDLKAVLSWKTQIALIKTIQADTPIGYGCTYKTTRKSKIAILPVGYSDGIRRNQSNNGYMLINGKQAPIRGRVMMNMTAIDITDIPNVTYKSEVVIIGEQNGQKITAEQVAELQGTINYEVVAQINPTIERKII